MRYYKTGDNGFHSPKLTRIQSTVKRSRSFVYQIYSKGFTHGKNARENFIENFITKRPFATTLLQFAQVVEKCIYKTMYSCVYVRSVRRIFVIKIYIFKKRRVQDISTKRIRRVRFNFEEFKAQFKHLKRQ